MDSFNKNISESLTIEIKFNDSLNTGELINSQTTVTYLNNELVTGIVTTSSILNSSIFVKVSGGLLGETYVLKTTAITSYGNTIVKEIAMYVEEGIPLDKNIENIKLVGELTDVDDNKINFLTMQFLNEITDYCNNYFIAKNSVVGYIYENRNLTFSEGTITATVDYIVPYRKGDYIRIHGTKWNDGLYKIISISGCIIKVDALLRDETIVASIYLINFPQQLLNMISDYVKKCDSDDNISKEKIGDAEYTYFQGSSKEGFFSANLSKLQPYRKLYKDNLNKSIKWSD